MRTDALEQLSHPQRLRPAFPAAPAAIRRREHGRTAIRRRSRSCSSSAFHGGPGSRGCGMPTGIERCSRRWCSRRSVALEEAGARLHFRLLAEPHIEQLILARPDPQAPIGDASLLQMLLRHALLREIATRPHGCRPTRPAPISRPCSATPSSWISSPARSRPITGGASSKNADRDRRPDDPRVSRDQTTFTTPALAALGEFRSSLADLKNLDSEALAQLMQGTLDLSRTGSTRGSRRSPPSAWPRCTWTDPTASTSGPTGGSRTSRRCPPRS